MSRIATGVILSEAASDTQIREAHERAVEMALNYAETNFSQAWITNEDVTRKMATGNL